MRGLVRVSSRCLASYRDGRRLSDAYTLLLTKKPVEHDYVAIDITALYGAAQRLAKNVSPEERRNKDIARHIHNAVQVLLRRVVCRHSLLLAFDGAGTAANVHAFRHAKHTRKWESRTLRLPGTAMPRAVEERLVKGMPLPRGLVPREVVIAGAGVEGCVERKVAAWALDLACRDGAQQHTTRSLCVIGTGSLWQVLLGLTPYFNCTHVVNGHADLRQLTLQDALAWLELSTDLQGGDTHAVTTCRTDALLLTLLGLGCAATDLNPLPGVNFTVLMDTYHTCRKTDWAAAERSVPSTEKATPETVGDVRAAAPSSSFQLLRELPHGVLELDLLALYLLFLPSRDAAAEIAALADNPAAPFSARAASSPSSDETGGSKLLTRSRVVFSGSLSVVYDSFLRHVLSSHYLLSYGLTTREAMQEPAYLSWMVGSEVLPAPQGGERRPARGTQTFSNAGGNGGGGGGGSSSVDSIAADTAERLVLAPTTGEDARKTSQLSVAEWVRYLRACIVQGQRYCTISAADLQPPSTPLPQTPSTDAASSPKDIGSEETSGSTAATTPSAASSPPYFPFWHSGQPWTAAEYTILCYANPSAAESLAREYVPGVSAQLHPDFARRLTSAELSVRRARDMAERLFAHASAVSPHPALCLAPSLCWTHNDKSRMWAMRYVDLGTAATSADVRYTRSLLTGGVAMAQPKAEEGAVAFESDVQKWVVQPVFPLPESDPTPTSAASASPPADAATARASTLKVLTWNVMFDRYNNQPTPLGMPGIEFCSPQRYPVLAKVIEQENADVVGMQEVEWAFAEYLAAQPWCRERYIMSCSPRSSLLDPWGVLLLVRRGLDAWPVRRFTHVNVPAWSGHVSLMPVVTLDLTSRNRCVRLTNTPNSATAQLVNVCSMHLLAPFVKAHETARTVQDQTLRQILTRQLHGHTMVMGDFNDWPQSEFVMPAETRYVDCWSLLRPGDYGKTMDETNTFCKLKIEEIFFGRSDKVFLRTGVGQTNANPLLKPVEAHLVGTRSVNAENGNQDAPAYLFPSDHYGVSVTFQVL